MISVFNTPVAADSVRCLFCADGGGADIEGGFLASVPQPVFGAALEGRSMDTDDARDEPIPGCFLERGASVENLYDAGLGAHTPERVGGFMARQWRIRLGDVLDLPQQAGLIFLHLNKQMAFCLAGHLESFFGSAWRPA